MRLGASAREAADAALARHPLFVDARSGQVDAVLAGLAGLFLDSSRQPPPVAMPTLRAFQRAEGLAALDWLIERWD